jgi:hypothetical protein
MGSIKGSTCVERLNTHKVETHNRNGKQGSHELACRIDQSINILAKVVQVMCVKSNNKWLKQNSRTRKQAQNAKAQKNNQN